MSEKTKKLLIVDDEVLICEYLSELLEELADEIFVAYDGEKALEILKEESIDCVVCDVKMPKLTGIEVIKAVRELGNEVPFIIYTGHGSEDLMRQFIPYGAFDFFNKPHMTGLWEAVNRAFIGAERTEEDNDFMSEYQKLLKTWKDEEK